MVWALMLSLNWLKNCPDLRNIKIADITERTYRYASIIN